MSSPSLFQRLFGFGQPTRPEGLAPGMYHARRAVGGGQYARYHLRVEEDGEGLLIVNASSVARLSPSGALMAHGLLHGEPESVVVERTRRALAGAPASTLEADVRAVNDLLDRLAAPDAPTFNLADMAFAPNAARLIAPLTADIPAGPADAIKPLVEKLWAIGIPHGVFTVTAETAPLALRAVERASDTGLITGVRGRSTDLRAQVGQLAQAGVDHVTVYYASHDRQVHDDLYGRGDHEAAQDLIRACASLEVTPVAELPLTVATLRDLDETLADLNERGIVNVGVFALPGEDIAAANDGVTQSSESAHQATSQPDSLSLTLTPDSLAQAAAQLEDSAHRNWVTYVWYPPVRGSGPLAARAQAGPRCSGDLAVRVELDGSVLPPRGPHEPAGNLLRDPWATIWGHPAFERYRQRLLAPTHCLTCPGLAICAADCPKAVEGFAVGESR